VVGHVAPEAAAGGPIALLEDGDRLIIDADQRSINLAVSDAELSRRRDTWVQPKRKLTGLLAKYAAMVASAAEGAVTIPLDSD